MRGLKEIEIRHKEPKELREIDIREKCVGYAGDPQDLRTFWQVRFVRVRYPILMVKYLISLRLT